MHTMTPSEPPVVVDREGERSIVVEPIRSTIYEFTFDFGSVGKDQDDQDLALILTRAEEPEREMHEVFRDLGID